LHANLSALTHISIGNVIFFESVLLIVVIYLFERKNFRWPAIIVSFIIGQAINLFQSLIFSHLTTPDNLLIQIVLFLIGTAITTMGVSLYIIPRNYPVAALDEVMLFIVRYYNWPL